MRFSPFRHLGSLAALIALVSQMVLGGLVLPNRPLAPAAALAALSVICHAEAPAQKHPRPAHHPRRFDPALCPLSVALALPGALLAPAPLLPAAPLLMALRIARVPPARALPFRAAAAAYPRGPPSLA